MPEKAIGLLFFYDPTDRIFLPEQNLLQPVIISDKK